MFSSLLLLAVVILPSVRPANFAGFTGLGEYLDAWKAVSPTLAHQEEQGVALREVAAAGVEVRAQLEQLLVDFTELIKIVQVTHNATSQLLFQFNSSQLLTDLQTLRGRQAVSGAVQVGQVLMFVAYLLTIAVLYMVKRCHKASERKKNQEFELLEQKLQANKTKRRAAAASARTQPEITSQPAQLVQ